MQKKSLPGQPCGSTADNLRKVYKHPWTVGLASANKLGSKRVIVPVRIIGDQDGQWDRAAWKTEAFYGNPLTGFTASP